MQIKDQLIDFIEKNYNEFSNLSDSETAQLSLDDSDLNDDIINYLKDNYRFDYKGICVYYVKDEDEIWVENMES
jgi:hypothetical protein